MALKALMLRKQIDTKQKERDALNEKTIELEKREAELETAIREAEAAEEMETVNAEIEKFNTEKAAHSAALSDIEREIEELEASLREAETEVPEIIPEAREEKKYMQTAEKRNRFGLTEEIVTRDDVKAFLGEIRSAISEKRAISGAGLTIPTVIIGMIKENVINYSKLYRHVFVRRIGGEGKLVVMGTIPEAIWTACCANINEVNLSFADVTVDCNKVAAFVPVCNAVLDDSDVNLAAEIIEALAISIGKALDKAILYGTGSGMPLGVYTRLAQQSQPGTYPATARTWVDLHSTNMLTIANSVSGTALFQTIMLDSAVMSGKYSRGEMVWCMNELTYKYLKAQGMSVNAAGQIVSAVEGSMPAVGGIVEVLDFVPNYNIVGGYFDCYLLGERQAMQIESADRVNFVEDETIFRAKARYDGQPAIAEAFIALALYSQSLAGASMASDAANTPAFIQMNKSAATLETTTGTVQLKARVLNAYGVELKGQTITWASSVTAKAEVSTSGLVTGKAAGSSVITATCGDAVGVCNVTVPS